MPGDSISKPHSNAKTTISVELLEIPFSQDPSEYKRVDPSLVEIKMLRMQPEKEEKIFPPFIHKSVMTHYIYADDMSVHLFMSLFLGKKIIQKNLAHPTIRAVTVNENTNNVLSKIKTEIDFFKNEKNVDIVEDVDVAKSTDVLVLFFQRDENFDDSFVYQDQNASPAKYNKKKKWNFESILLDLHQFITDFNTKNSNKKKEVFILSPAGAPTYHAVQKTFSQRPPQYGEYTITLSPSLFLELTFDSQMSLFLPLMQALWREESSNDMLRQFYRQFFLELPHSSNNAAKSYEKLLSDYFESHSKVSLQELDPEINTLLKLMLDRNPINMKLLSDFFKMPMFKKFLVNHQNEMKKIEQSDEKMGSLLEFYRNTPFAFDKQALIIEELSTYLTLEGNVPKIIFYEVLNPGQSEEAQYERLLEEGIIPPSIELFYDAHNFHYKNLLDGKNRIIILSEQEMKNLFNRFMEQKNEVVAAFLKQKKEIPSKFYYLRVRENLSANKKLMITVIDGDNGLFYKNLNFFNHVKHESSEWTDELRLTGDGATILYGDLLKGEDHFLPIKGGYFLTQKLDLNKFSDIYERAVDSEKLNEIKFLQLIEDTLVDTYAKDNPMAESVMRAYFQKKLVTFQLRINALSEIPSVLKLVTQFRKFNIYFLISCERVLLPSILKKFPLTTPLYHLSSLSSSLILKSTLHSYWIKRFQVKDEEKIERLKSFVEQSIEALKALPSENMKAFLKREHAFLLAEELTPLAKDYLKNTEKANVIFDAKHFNLKELNRKYVKTHFDDKLSSKIKEKYKNENKFKDLKVLYQQMLTHEFLVACINSNELSFNDDRVWIENAKKIIVYDVLSNNEKQNIDDLIRFGFAEKVSFLLGKKKYRVFPLTNFLDQKTKQALIHDYMTQVLTDPKPKLRNEKIKILKELLFHMIQLELHSPIQAILFDLLIQASPVFKFIAEKQLESLDKYLELNPTKSLFDVNDRVLGINVFQFLFLFDFNHSREERLEILSYLFSKKPLPEVVQAKMWFNQIQDGLSAFELALLRARREGDVKLIKKFIHYFVQNNISLTPLNHYVSALLVAGCTDIDDADIQQLKMLSPAIAEILSLLMLFILKQPSISSDQYLDNLSNNGFTWQALHYVLDVEKNFLKQLIENNLDSKKNTGDGYTKHFELMRTFLITLLKEPLGLYAKENLLAKIAATAMSIGHNQFDPFAFVELLLNDLGITWNDIGHLTISPVENIAMEDTLSFYNLFKKESFDLDNILKSEVVIKRYTYAKLFLLNLAKQKEGIQVFEKVYNIFSISLKNDSLLFAFFAAISAKNEELVQWILKNKSSYYKEHEYAAALWVALFNFKILKNSVVFKIIVKHLIDKKYFNHLRSILNEQRYSYSGMSYLAFASQLKNTEIFGSLKKELVIKSPQKELATELFNKTIYLVFMPETIYLALLSIARIGKNINFELIKWLFSYGQRSLEIKKEGIELQHEKFKEIENVLVDDINDQMIHNLDDQGKYFEDFGTLGREDYLSCIRKLKKAKQNAVVLKLYKDKLNEYETKLSEYLNMDLKDLLDTLNSFSKDLEKKFQTLVSMLNVILKQEKDHLDQVIFYDSPLNQNDQDKVDKNENSFYKYDDYKNSHREFKNKLEKIQLEGRKIEHKDFKLYLGKFNELLDYVFNLENGVFQRQKKSNHENYQNSIKLLKQYYEKAVSSIDTRIEKIIPGLPQLLELKISNINTPDFESAVDQYTALITTIMKSYHSSGLSDDVKEFIRLLINGITMKDDIEAWTIFLQSAIENTLESLIQKEPKNIHLNLNTKDDVHVNSRALELLTFLSSILSEKFTQEKLSQFFLNLIKMPVTMTSIDPKDSKKFINYQAAAYISMILEVPSKVMDQDALAEVLLFFVEKTDILFHDPHYKEQSFFGLLLGKGYFNVAYKLLLKYVLDKKSDHFIQWIQSFFGWNEKSEQNLDQSIKQNKKEQYIDKVKSIAQFFLYFYSLEENLLHSSFSNERTLWRKFFQAAATEIDFSSYDDFNRNAFIVDLLHVIIRLKIVSNKNITIEELNALLSTLAGIISSDPEQSKNLIKQALSLQIMYIDHSMTFLWTLLIYNHRFDLADVLVKNGVEFVPGMTFERFHGVVEGDLAKRNEKLRQYFQSVISLLETAKLPNEDFEANICPLTLYEYAQLVSYLKMNNKPIALFLKPFYFKVEGTDAKEESESFQKLIFNPKAQSVAEKGKHSKLLFSVLLDQKKFETAAFLILCWKVIDPNFKEPFGISDETYEALKNFLQQSSHSMISYFFVKIPGLSDALSRQINPLFENLAEHKKDANGEKRFLFLDLILQYPPFHSERRSNLQRAVKSLLQFWKRKGEIPLFKGVYLNFLEALKTSDTESLNIFKSTFFIQDLGFEKTALVNQFIEALRFHRVGQRSFFDMINIASSKVDDATKGELTNQLINFASDIEPVSSFFEAIVLSQVFRQDLLRIKFNRLSEFKEMIDILFEIVFEKNQAQGQSYEKHPDQRNIIKKTFVKDFLNKELTLVYRKETTFFAEICIYQTIDFITFCLEQGGDPLVIVRRVQENTLSLLPHFLAQQKNTQEVEEEKFIKVLKLLSVLKSSVLDSTMDQYAGVDIVTYLKLLDFIQNNPQDQIQQQLSVFKHLFYIREWGREKTEDFNKLLSLIKSHLKSGDFNFEKRVIDAVIMEAGKIETAKKQRYGVKYTPIQGYIPLNLNTYARSLEKFQGFPKRWQLFQQFFYLDHLNVEQSHAMNQLTLRVREKKILSEMSKSLPGKISMLNEIIRVCQVAQKKVIAEKRKNPRLEPALILRAIIRDLFDQIIVPRERGDFQVVDIQILGIIEIFIDIFKETFSLENETREQVMQEMEQKLFRSYNKLSSNRIITALFVSEVFRQMKISYMDKNESDDAVLNLLVGIYKAKPSVYIKLEDGKVLQLVKFLAEKHKFSLLVSIVKCLEKLELSSKVPKAWLSRIDAGTYKELELYLDVYHKNTPIYERLLGYFQVEPSVQSVQKTIEMLQRSYDVLLRYIEALGKSDFIRLEPVLALTMKEQSKQNTRRKELPLASILDRQCAAISFVFHALSLHKSAPGQGAQFLRNLQKIDQFTQRVYASKSSDVELEQLGKFNQALRRVQGMIPKDSKDSLTSLPLSSRLSVDRASSLDQLLHLIMGFAGEESEGGSNVLVSEADGTLHVIAIRWKNHRDFIIFDPQTFIITVDKDNFSNMLEAFLDALDYKCLESGEFVVERVQRSVSPESAEMAFAKQLAEPLLTKSEYLQQMDRKKPLLLIDSNQNKYRISRDALDRAGLKFLSPIDVVAFLSELNEIDVKNEDMVFDRIRFLEYVVSEIQSDKSLETIGAFLSITRDIPLSNKPLSKNTRLSQDDPIERFRQEVIKDLVNGPSSDIQSEIQEDSINGANKKIMQDKRNRINKMIIDVAKTELNEKQYNVWSARYSKILPASTQGMSKKIVGVFSHTANIATLIHSFSQMIDAVKQGAWDEAMTGLSEIVLSMTVFGVLSETTRKVINQMVAELKHQPQFLVDKASSKQFIQNLKRVSTALNVKLSPSGLKSATGIIDALFDVAAMVNALDEADHKAPGSPEEQTKIIEAVQNFSYVLTEMIAAGLGSGMKTTAIGAALALSLQIFWEAYHSGTKAHAYGEQYALGIEERISLFFNDFVGAGISSPLQEKMLIKDFFEETLKSVLNLLQHDSSAYHAVFRAIAPQLNTKLPQPLKASKADPGIYQDGLGGFFLIHPVNPLDLNFESPFDHRVSEKPMNALSVPRFVMKGWMENATIKQFLSNEMKSDWENQNAPNYAAIIREMPIEENGAAVICAPPGVGHEQADAQDQTAMRCMNTIGLRKTVEIVNSPSIFYQFKQARYAIIVPFIPLQDGPAAPEYTIRCARDTALFFRDVDTSVTSQGKLSIQYLENVGNGDGRDGVSHLYSMIEARKNNVFLTPSHVDINLKFAVHKDQQDDKDLTTALLSYMQQCQRKSSSERPKTIDILYTSTPANSVNQTSVFIIAQDTRLTGTLSSANNYRLTVIVPSFKNLGSDSMQRQGSISSIELKGQKTIIFKDNVLQDGMLHYDSNSTQLSVLNLNKNTIVMDYAPETTFLMDQAAPDTGIMRLIRPILNASDQLNHENPIPIKAVDLIFPNMPVDSYGNPLTDNPSLIEWVMRHTNVSVSSGVQIRQIFIHQVPTPVMKAHGVSDPQILIHHNLSTLPVSKSVTTVINTGKEKSSYVLLSGHAPMLDVISHGGGSVELIFLNIPEELKKIEGDLLIGSAKVQNHRLVRVPNCFKENAQCTVFIKCPGVPYRFIVQKDENGLVHRIPFFDIKASLGTVHQLFPSVFRGDQYKQVMFDALDRSDWRCQRIGENLCLRIRTDFNVDPSDETDLQIVFMAYYAEHEPWVGLNISSLDKTGQIESLAIAAKIADFGYREELVVDETDNSIVANKTDGDDGRAFFSAEEEVINETLHHQSGPYDEYQDEYQNENNSDLREKRSAQDDVSQDMVASSSVRRGGILFSSLACIGAAVQLFWNERSSPYASKIHVMKNEPHHDSIKTIESVSAIINHQQKQKNAPIDQAHEHLHSHHNPQKYFPQEECYVATFRKHNFVHCQQNVPRQLITVLLRLPTDKPLPLRLTENDVQRIPSGWKIIYWDGGRQSQVPTLVLEKLNGERRAFLSCNGQADNGNTVCQQSRKIMRFNADIRDDKMLSIVGSNVDTRFIEKVSLLKSEEVLIVKFKNDPVLLRIPVTTVPPEALFNQMSSDMQQFVIQERLKEQRITAFKEAAQQAFSSEIIFRYLMKNTPMGDFFKRLLHMRLDWANEADVIRFSQLFFHWVNGANLSWTLAACLLEVFARQECLHAYYEQNIRPCIGRAIIFHDGDHAQLSTYCAVNWLKKHGGFDGIQRLWYALVHCVSTGMQVGLNDPFKLLMHVFNLLQPVVPAVMQSSLSYLKILFQTILVFSQAPYWPSACTLLLPWAQTCVEQLGVTDLLDQLVASVQKTFAIVFPVFVYQQMVLKVQTLTPLPDEGRVHLLENITLEKEHRWKKIEKTRVTCRDTLKEGSRRMKQWGSTLFRCNPNRANQAKNDPDQFGPNLGKNWS